MLKLMQIKILLERLLLTMSSPGVENVPLDCQQSILELNPEPNNIYKFNMVFNYYAKK